MPFLEKLLIQFGISFVLFALSCFAGDDDVVYELVDKKPTPHQAIQRIRFVILKLFVSFFGGAWLSVWIATSLLRDSLGVHMSGSQPLLILIPCVGIGGLLAGAFQNIVRQAQNRKIRPLVDVAVFKSVARQWTRFFRQ